MGFRIPQEFIDRVREQVDLVELVSEYVPLKRTGRSFVGLCPFHSEKTPSFSVSQEKQFFHCFGCGVGGNVFSFVMQMEHISFVEAVKMLANRANIPFQFDEQKLEHDETYRKRKRMIAAHDLASKFYNYILMNTEAGVQALRYLEKRGIRKRTIDEFQIGYAPDSWDTLAKFLRRRGFDPTLLLECGLLNQSVNQPERYFDRFRNRIMFPVHDGQGNCIAFGGRILDEGEPKYLNSPETPIFHKGQVLYNLHRARSAIRRNKQAVLFEGYMDVISAYQAGVTNGVAALGTALTMEQARILKRNADDIILAYDGDKAGINATRKNSLILADAGIRVKVAVMPNGLDPDEVIRDLGEETFRTLVSERTQTSAEYVLEAMRKDYAMSTTEGKARYMEAAIAYLATLASPIEQEMHLRSLADEFQVSLEALKATMQTRMREHKETETAQPGSRSFQASAADGWGNVQTVLPAHIVAEKFLLTHMLLDSRVIRQVQELGFHEFSVDEHNVLYAHLIRYLSEHDSSQLDPASFFAYLQDPKIESLAASLLARAETLDARPGLIDEYVRRIQVHQLETALHELEKKLIECGNRGDLESMRQIQESIAHIRQEIQKTKDAGKLGKG
jgi:DNA primase